MNSIMETIFGLLGGLALFLFGMNMMSESLQKAAGEKMKSILAMLTKNPVLGVLAGALVTAVLQSSSATTVMVIGFVSAGLMELPQGVSVILGANIGTTMTAQLMAFKISDYIWAIVFVGFIILFVAKKEKIRCVGETIFAFGILFEGIEVMGSVMKPLASSPVFTDMIQKVADVPVLGVAVGTLMTLVVQSSSATIAVLQNFASQAGPDGVTSVLGLTGAIPILLGDNIGTTITALLACIGQSKNAKRTAVAHTVFNLSGSLVFIWLVPWFARFVQWFSPKGPEVEVISRQIANAHTTFNIACTLIWLPMIGILVKIVNFIVRGEDGKPAATAASKYLDYKLIAQPVFAIKMITQELNDICGIVKNMLPNLQTAIEDNNISKLNKVQENCNKVEQRNDEMMQYMAAMFAAGSLTENQAGYVSDMMLIMENVEHIEKRCSEISGFVATKIEKGYKYSSEAAAELKKNLNSVAEIYDSVIRYLEGDSENPQDILSQRREKILKQRNKARRNNSKRMQEHKCQKENGVLFNRILFSLDRITHDCFNLLENDISQFRFDGIEEEEQEQLEKGI